jgi:hypothetical protein
LITGYNFLVTTSLFSRFYDYNRRLENDYLGCRRRFWLKADSEERAKDPVIAHLRKDFNRRFQVADYQSLVSRLRVRLGCEVGFRIAETPAFVPKDLMHEMCNIGAELTNSLIGNPDYLKASAEAIPMAYRFAGCGKHPHFMTADFGLVREADGRLSPRIVELQAFPSVFGYQTVLCDEYRHVYHLDSSLDFLLGDLSDEAFWALMGRVILNGHDPKNVVLTEVDPWHQKTLADFLVTADRLKIQIIDIAQLVPVGNKLHYRDADGALVPIHRIYNRAIVDELIAKKIELPFDCTQPLDVEWAGHPNWYFHVSKFSLPYLDHPAVPPAVFLNDWLAGRNRERLNAGEVDTPEGPRYEQLLLKPLFSFAGKGIQFSPTLAELEAIPEESRGEYLLQQRVAFEPVIDTPHGMTQAEIRILYVWPDGGDLQAVLSLVRLGRGKMMGVDHNRNLEWVGSSAAFFPRR